MQVQEKLKQLIDEAFDQVKQTYQAEINDLQTKIEALEAKLRIQTDAETDRLIAEITAHQQMSVEAWIRDVIKQEIDSRYTPRIPVRQDFYKRLKELAAMRGVTIQSITTTQETTRRFLSLIDNLLL